MYENVKTERRIMQSASKERVSILHAKKSERSPPGQLKDRYVLIAECESCPSLNNTVFVFVRTKNWGFRVHPKHAKVYFRQRASRVWEETNQTEEVNQKYSKSLSGVQQRHVHIPVKYNKSTATVYQKYIKNTSNAHCGKARTDKLPNALHTAAK